MKLKTNKLLVFTLLAIAMIFVVATVPEFFGMDKEDSIYVALLWTLIFGLNVAGLVLGIGERKKDLKKARIGIIGHSLLILFFLIVIVSAVITA